MKNFEERLRQLEDIADRMKEGDTPLDDAVSMFEREFLSPEASRRTYPKSKKRLRSW